MRNCRSGKKENSIDTLTSIISDKAYGFIGDDIEQGSIDEIRETALSYLTNVCRIHRISEDLIKTLNIVITPNEADQTKIEVAVQADDELLQLFIELNIK